MNILYLDKEGGFGGSGRSLYFLIRHIDRQRFVPFVLAGEDGPNRRRYEKLDVAWSIAKIPAYKPSKRKNLFSLLLFGLKMPRILAAIFRLGNFIRNHEIDVIHLNHDGFFPYAIVNAWLWRLPVVQHMRTMTPVNLYGRLQCALIYRYSTRLIFITERERECFAALCAKQATDPKFAIIPNIVDMSNDDAEASPDWMDCFTGRFIAVWLGNIAYSKGADRIVDIAREWKNAGWLDGIIVACGGQRNIGSKCDDLMPGMMAHIRDEGLENWVHFAGFQENTAAILAKSHVLIRITRENDPWGRDVIEAVSAGKPVLAVGTDSPYIQHGETGMLFSDFDPGIFARFATTLAQHPEEYHRLAATTRERFKDTFSGRILAPRVEAIYTELCHAPPRGN